MAGVAQLVRAPDCGPGGREFDSRRPPHLFFDTLGCRQVVKAPDFDSGIRRFKSCHPSHLYGIGPLAQSVEHLIFNQGVRSSSLRWTTTKKTISFEMVFFVYVVIGARTSVLPGVRARSEKHGSLFPTEQLTSDAALAQQALRLTTKRNLNRTTLWRLGFFFYAKRQADLYNTSACRSAILMFFDFFF